MTVGLVAILQHTDNTARTFIITFIVIIIILSICRNCFLKVYVINIEGSQ